MNRRDLIVTGTAALGGAMAAGCASVTANTSAPTPFTVAGVTIPVVGTSEVFPVRRIYCIGRNYAAHAREMGSDPTREPPFFFQKPTDAIQYIAPGKTVDHPYPSLTKNYHYEIELVAALKSGGKDITMQDALSHVYGYAVGLDMSAPIGPIHRVSQIGHIGQAGITLSVNGVGKQKSNLTHMIWSVAEQIVRLSQAFELKAGDIIYSGTPENVGPVVRGDVMLGHIDGLPDISVKVV
jgi:2-keto-4-pentenoate hydratase/2-oxohepta-3-ene-1,7-dioic acid hydratase in catechol pathway